MGHVCNKNICLALQLDVLRNFRIKTVLHSGSIRESVSIRRAVVAENYLNQTLDWSLKSSDVEAHVQGRSAL